MDRNQQTECADARAPQRFAAARPVDPFILFPRDAIAQSIPARFAQQVARGPGRLAVKCGADELTYDALNRSANRVAHAILAAAGRAAEPVVILIEQSAPLTAAILGTLKAGKIYVPLDPSFPPALLAGQVEDAGARLILTSRHSGAVAWALSQAPRPKPRQLSICVIEVDAIAAGQPTHDPDVSITPDAGAYIFYTSGSTGRPKGVLDSHRNVLHNVMRYTNTLRICADDRLTLLQGPSFSGAVSSLFCALLNGAAVFPFDVPREGAHRIAAWLERERITVYHSVPALFRHVAESGGSLTNIRTIRLEGDQATPRDIELFRDCFPRGTVLVNGLGATECGIVRQLFVDHDTPDCTSIVPVGYPVDGMEVAVLSETGHEAPAGGVGEIVVRSRYLATGYWRQPELTAMAFRAEPGADGMRSYRTGDLGRLRPDGCLEHLGRSSSHPKIGGNRVLIAEVEAALLEVPGLKQAAVATREDPDGEPRLVAYLVASQRPGPTVSAIRRCLAQRLPAYMIPSAYVMLDALPLTANGKVDRGALPSPSSARPDLDAVRRDPEDLLQFQLVRIWEEVLAVAPIGIGDDFFELGGSSLLAVKMVRQVERLYGRKVSLSAMLAGATVEQFAEAIKREADALAGPIVRVQAGGSRPPFFFLHGDYLGGGLYCRRLAERIGPDQPFYALPPFGLDDEPIPDSYQAMAERHLAALRTVQPNGPYRLGGSCNGGLVALEMARLLLGEGEQIDRLILIGATAMNVRWRLSGGPISALGCWMRRRPSRHYDRFLAIVLTWDSLRPSERARLALRQLLKVTGRPAGLLRRFGNRGDTLAPPFAALTPDPGIADRRKRTRETYRRIDKDYTPAPYPGRVIVLWPSDDIERPQAATWWRAVARAVDFRVVPGNHATSPTVHANALADELRRCLIDKDAADDVIQP